MNLPEFDIINRKKKKLEYSKYFFFKLKSDLLIFLNVIPECLEESYFIEKNIEICYVKNIEELVQLVSKKITKRVTILGCYVEFSYKNVNKINLEMKNRNIFFNLIIGKNQEELLKNLKLISTKNKKNEQNYMIDSIFNNSLSKEQINEILLKSQFKNLLICAHGEGVHLNLLNTVICGENSSLNNEIKDLKGGCGGNQCRKLNEHLENLVKAKDIECDSIYLLTCNGFSINSEMFNTEGSLIDGFLSGEKVNEILTTIRPLEVTPKTINIFKKLVDYDYSATFICWLMNDVELLIRKSIPFIVINGRNTDLVFLEKINIGEELSITHETIKVFKMNFDVENCFYTYNYTGEQKIDVTLGKETLIVTFNKPPNGKITIIDGTKIVNYAKEYLNAFAREIENVSYFLETLVVILNLDTESSVEYKRCNKSLREIKKNINDIIKYMHSIEKERVYDSDKVEKNIMYIKVAKRNLSKLLLVLFVKSDANKYMQKILLAPYFKNNEGLYKEFSCPRCANDLEIYKLKSILTYLEEKKLIFCPLCETHSILPVEVKINTKIEVLDEDLLLTIDCIAANNEGNNAFLILDITDKSKGVKLDSIIEAVDIGNIIRLILPKPKDLGIDLHSYKGILIIGLNVICFHGRFEHSL